MSLLANDRRNLPHTFGLVAPARSHLFSELLDANHDAWRVLRKGDTWTFYREIGEGRVHLPLGAVTLTTGPGVQQTLDFVSTKGTRSLLPTYGPEVAAAAQHLMDREYCVELFSRLARMSTSSFWDYKLSFCGARVTERYAKLRESTPIFQRVAGDANEIGIARGSSCFSYHGPTQRPGLVVSQHEQKRPLIECYITYPRPITMRFFSSKLTVGLEAITNPTASLVLELNGNLEQGYREFGTGDY
jgi:hypothetical protein